MSCLRCGADSGDYICPTCGSAKREVRKGVADKRVMGAYLMPCPDPSHDAPPKRTLEAMLADLWRVELAGYDKAPAACHRLESDLRDGARLREATEAAQVAWHNTTPADMSDLAVAMDALLAALERSSR